MPGGRRIIAVSPVVHGTMTYEQWAALLLRHVGAPVCGNDLISVVAWEVQERTAAAWNPLATTLAMPGASRFNSIGVRNYGSLEQGLDASLQLSVEALHGRAMKPSMSGSGKGAMRWSTVPVTLPPSA